MNILSQFGSRPGHFRRLILTATIVPAVLASSAFAANWNGPVALDTGSAPDDIHVLGNSTVTLANTGAGPSITENNIFFEPAIATETLTVNGAGLTLRSLATILSIANSKTITINGTADFAPGALSTGPTAGTATDTGIVLIKNGGTGTLLLDDPVNTLAGTTLRVFDGVLSIVGSGGTANPVSSLTTQIEIGTSTNGFAPVLRIGSNGTDTTFSNTFKVTNTGTIEHLTATNDTLSTAGSVNPIASGKTLTVNVAAGSLTLNGTMASTLNPNSAGGILRKTGIDTTLTIAGSVFLSNINVAEGRVNVPGRFRMTAANNPIIAPNAILSLRNQSTSLPNFLPSTITVSTGTLEGVPGAFVTTGGAQSTLSLTGGTLNLGVGGSGLTAHLYNGDDVGARLAFGGPNFPGNNYANYVNYFTGRGAGLVTLTGANAYPDLSFAPGGGDTPMFAPIAPTYTATNNIVSRFNGKIVITTAGAYTFATSSDDGSMLYINGAAVVSNNAYQGLTRRTGTVSLTPGLHDIDIGYYEGGGANTVIVDYSGPDTGDAQTVVPNSILIPTDSPASLAFLNPVSVSQNSTINAIAGASVASTAVSVGKVLNVTGYKFSMGAVTLTGGNGTYTINAGTLYGEVTAKSVAAGGSVVALVNNGAGTLILDAPSSPQTMGVGSTVSVTNGALGLVLGGANSTLGNAVIGSVNGHGLILSSVGGDQTMALPAFNLGGSISARKIGSGVAGTVGTPIRMTATGNLALDNGTTLNLGTQDNYVLAMAGISGNATVNIRGTVETSGVVNVGGPLNVLSSRLTTAQSVSAGPITISESTVTANGAISATSIAVNDSTVTTLGNITSPGGITLTGGNVATRLNLNGGAVSGGPIMVNMGATLWLGADDVLGNFSGGISSLTVNGANVTAVAGTHSTLPTMTLNGGTLGATGPGNAPTGPTINYILNGNVTTVPGATPSTISAPAILLRGAGTNGPVTFTVPRGTAETDFAVTSAIHDGGAGLIKNGDGIMALSGANTYTGPTVINAGTVVASGQSSLGSSSVRLNNGGVLSLVSPPSFAGFGNVSLNGVATLDATNSIVTLTSNQLAQTGTVFSLSKYSVGDGFSASFVYTASGARAADGITFTVQNNAPTALGGGGGGLGYAGMQNSAALELNIYTGANQPIGTNFATNGATGTYIESVGVNLASGNPIKVDVVYDSTALTFTEILTDLVTSANYTNTFTVPALSGIIGGNLAYVGFTGATGGAVATQTVGSFVFNDFSQQGLTLANNITVSAGATGGLDVPQAGPGVGGAATLAGVLTLNAGSILNVTGGAIATDFPYSLDVTGSTTLSGSSTINVANNGTGLGTVHLDDVNQVGGNSSLTKTGAGTLVLSGALSFAVLNTSAGTTDLNSALANATINASGGKLNINANQTLAALNIGSTGVVVLGGSAPAALAFDPETAGAAAQAVPEPGSLNLLLAGALGWFARRQRPQGR